MATTIKAATDCKTWEDICTGLGIDPVKSLEFLNYTEDDDKKHMAADFKLKKFSKLCWKLAKKVPDLRDGKQPKWYPVFCGNIQEEPSSFGFSLSFTHYDCSASDVGLRLSYPDRYTSDHAGTQFEDWYRDLHVVIE